jgi:hypothetical protein
VVEHNVMCRLKRRGIAANLREGQTALKGGQQRSRPKNQSTVSMSYRRPYSFRRKVTFSTNGRAR